MARPGRRIFVALAVVIGAVLAAASPVAADPARPTDYESRVLGAEPALPDGFEIRVVGGDAFLELVVPRGHTAEVPDYGPDAPPYLRVRADGTVERNANATATALNERRYQAGDNRPVGGDPRWDVVARNGRYLWHDHRIHWMSPVRARVMTGSSDRRVDMGGPAGSWEVPLTIDGTPTVVSGELVLHPSPSVAPWVAVLALVAVGLVVAAVLAAKRSTSPGPRALVAGALLIGSVLAVVAGTVEWRSLPPGAGPGPLVAIVPLVGAIASVVALVSSRPSVQRGAMAAAVAALGGWAWLRRAVLARAVLPTTFPDPLDRAATALALGLALAGAVVLIWSPAPDPRRPTPPEGSDLA